MKRFPVGTLLLCFGAYGAGLLSHFLYERWQTPASHEKVHAVTFVPLPPAPESRELPLLEARDVDKLRALSGQQARVRGRVFRVGHSAKSDTYFLDFGPSRSALTAVVFASAARLFKEKKMDPKSYGGKEVEITGEVKDHPQYGLEIILEEPEQIRVLD